MAIGTCRDVAMESDFLRYDLPTNAVPKMGKDVPTATAKPLEEVANHLISSSASF